MKLLTRSNAPDTQLGIVERTGYMLGNVGTALMNTIVATYVMFYYTDVMYLNAAVIGAILLVSRLFDGVTDIIMGIVVDHTRSRFGKGRAWVLRMCLPYAACSILMMSVPAEGSDLFKYIYVFITYNLCNTICLTAVYVPYNSLTYSLSSNPYERGLLGVFVMFGAVLGTMVVNSTVDAWTKALGGTPAAWRTVCIIYAVSGMLLHLVCFFTTKERYAPDNAAQGSQKPRLKDEIKSVLTNKYWLIAVAVVFLVMLFTNILGSTGMYFAKGILGDTKYYEPIANAMSISQLVMLLLAFLAMKKFGKRKTALAGVVLIAAGCAAQYFVSQSLSGTVVCSLLRGMGAGLSGACGYGLVADTIDYGEWKSGIAASGIGMSALTFVTKVTGGLGGALVGLLTDRFGYDPKAAVQSPEAASAIVALFTVIPFVCVALSAVLLFFYDLDDLYPKIRKELDERKGASANV